MTRAPSRSAEPVIPSKTEPAASAPSAALLAAAAEAVERAIHRRAVAVIAGGSHARGEAVWAEVSGRRVSISDVDLWVQVRDEAEKRDVLLRWQQGLGEAVRELRAQGLEGALDAGFYTARDLEALPARLSTLDLAGNGLVIRGDVRALERIPDHGPRDVPGEEIALLLENRGFELLLAWADHGASDPISRLRARHASMKCMLDLAAILMLGRGEWHATNAERVAWARARLASRVEPELAGLATQAESLWPAALAWREALAQPLPEPMSRAEWRRVAGAWVAVWSWLTARPASGCPAAAAESDPYRRAVLWAGRARLRRRLRQAVTFRPRTGPRPGLTARLAYAGRGTPQHRLNAAAAVLLLSVVQSPGASPALGPSARDALRALGFREASGSWPEARHDLVRTWDRWILDGQRTAATP